ncbi:MAG: HEAT repeat domain-containing protein, partial [Candidatus Acidiferrum sp.]
VVANLGPRLGMPKQILIAALLAGAFIGCGKKEPITAGGITAEQWIAAMKNADAPLRVKAVRKLSSLIRFDKAALPGVIAALTDDAPEVRAEAIQSLAGLTGENAKEVLPAMREVAKADADPKNREAAARAMVQMTAH